VRLDDLKEVVPGRTGLSNLTDYWAAEALIVKFDPATGECLLSKPLPKPLSEGEEVLLATLKYLPLFPVGTPQFEETAWGWVKYALLVCRILGEEGIRSFDLEIWNELTFGSNFLNINNYFDPPAAHFKVDFLRPGGQAWELARRTIEAVKREFPEARCIWGFSNTTFFHTPIEELPPLTDGQSYHPYGTGTRKFPEQEQYRERPELNLEGFTPRFTMRMPEGWAHTFIQTESLMRLLNPKDRLKRRPKGVKRFYHYMTEHGVVPPECGVHDERGAWELKTKCLLRSFCFWLNKGIDVLHYFCAYGRSPLEMGLLPPGLEKLPSQTPFERVATPPLRALRNLVRAFEGSQPLKEVCQLSVDVVALGKQRAIFEGDAKHPPLWRREVFAFLPFQVNERKFVIAVYVMTYDATEPSVEERFRLFIGGLPGRPVRTLLYDPLRDQKLPVSLLERRSKAALLEIRATDYPRLLVLEVAKSL